MIFGKHNLTRVYENGESMAATNQNVDSQWRTLAKASSWRLIAASITTTIAWCLTGETAFAATVGAIDTFIKFGSYYFHERVWEQVGFGKAKSPAVSFHLSKGSKKHDFAKLHSRGRTEIGRRA